MEEVIQAFFCWNYLKVKQKIYSGVQYEIFYKPDNGHNYQKFFFEFHVWIVYHFCPSHARAKFQFFGNLQNHDRPTLISRMVWNQMIAILNWNLNIVGQWAMKNRSIRECFKNVPTNDIYVTLVCLKSGLLKIGNFGKFCHFLKHAIS